MSEIVDNGWYLELGGTALTAGWFTFVQRLTIEIDFSTNDNLDVMEEQEALTIYLEKSKRSSRNIKLELTRK